MKKAIVLLLFMLIFSCESSTKKKEEKPVVVQEPVKEVVVEKKVEKVDNTLVSLKKAPCSGDCPVFKITVTKDSMFTYHGEEYTAVIGKQQFKLSDVEFKKLTAALNNSGFETLKSQYSNQEAKDFSKTTITYQGKNVSVRLWKDAPKELTNVYVALEDILYDHKLLEE